MEKRVLALSLLAIVVVTSGCTPGGNSEGTDSEGNAAISVHELSVSPTEIYQGSQIGVTLQFANTGNTNATLAVEEDGENVFKNYCPDIFTIDSFQSTPNEIKSEEEVSFLPGQEAELQWTLDQDASVPLNGYRCNLDVEIPFNYSVSSYRQVQVKQSDNIEGSTSLSSESSTGPLKFAIQAIRGTGEEGESTYVAGQDETAQILFQLQNKQKDEYAKGLIDVDESSMSINGEAPFNIDLDSDRCDFDPANDNIRMFEGQSRIISCTVDLQGYNPDTPSIISEITASIDYTYLKQTNEYTVNVKYRGN